MHLGRYRLLAQLGAGRDAVAYRAERDDGTLAEVRILSAAKADATRWPILTRRLKLAEMIDHPGAAVVRELALDNDPPFVALEWTSAQSSTDDSRCDNGMSVDEAAGLVRDAAGALAAAHRLGLAHGDVSMTALRSASPGKIKLDFTGINAQGEASPAEDVRALTDIFRRLLRDRDRVPIILERLLDEMGADDLDARPSARAVEARLNGLLVMANTVDSLAVPAQAAWTLRTVDAPSGAMAELLSKNRSGMPALDERRTLGRFQLLDKLGEGGMGAVYRAEDPVDRRVVALKVLRPDFAARPGALERFHKEARLLAEVNNPYVANLLEVNEDDGIHYLTMEFVAGPSLDKLLDERGRLDESTALTIMADVARALVDAHQRGIVHRDIKPENVLLAPNPKSQIRNPKSQIPNPKVEYSEHGDLDGPDRPNSDSEFRISDFQVKLADFGLARHVVESASLMVTQAGTAVGTPAYMSPEQCLGQPTDVRSDVYGLGVTLFELLAGRPPFEADTALALMAKHCDEPPPALGRLVPGLSEGVCQIVEKALAKAPEARYADATAVLRDLERVLRGEPTSITVHPKLPACDPARVLSYDWILELEASPRELWPYVSNTERLNRAVGLPAVKYTTRTDGRRIERNGQFRKAGLTAAWKEHPFEWIEARRFGVLREYTQGPFRWMIGITELSPRAGGGTTLAFRVRIEPNGLLGRTVAAVEVGLKGRRAVERVIRRIDAFLTGKLGHPAGVDPFEERASMSGGKQRRLDQLLDRLSERRVEPAVVERLGEFLAHAPAQEVARMRPLALARRWGLPAERVVSACLHGAREGLLILLWDLLCPICRIASEIKDTLRELREHGHCPACNLDYQLDFAQSVEMIFRAHPEIRDTQLGTYCIGGPAHSPHVVAQVRVGPGERMELDLALGEGAYRLRGPQLPYALDFRVQPSAATNRWELSLSRGPGLELPRVLRGGAQCLALSNDGDQELVARVERAAQRDDALTAARAASLALFRELFPGEVLSPGQLISVANVTLLITALHGARGWYDALGDAKAFGLLHDHFRQLDDRIRKEGGALVKTIGEGVVAAFPDAASAVRVALDLPALSENMWPAIAVHRGPAMAATINDHLDYFGATVNQAMELLEIASAGQLVLTQAVASDPQVTALLHERGFVGELLDGMVQRFDLV